MTIHEWLKYSTERLKAADISTARLDAEVLLAAALNKDRSWVLAHTDEVLDSATTKKLDGQVKRRVSHEPLAYILGRQEFYGREFIVNTGTLQPRPETETMIELLISTVKNRRLTVGGKMQIFDVGTGSGCIAITTKLELPECSVTASDISKACLEIVKANADNLKADIDIVESDLLQDLNIKELNGSVICCNLPYVPDNMLINPAAKFEPELAIFGGKDGLDYYRQLFEQIISIPENLRPAIIFTEALPSQHVELAKIADVAEYTLQETKDFIQVFTRLR